MSIKKCSDGLPLIKEKLCATELDGSMWSVVSAVILEVDEVHGKTAEEQRLAIAMLVSRQES